MKAKLDFRSKRTIIITAIIAALAVGAGIGAYFYAKGNNEASATTQNTDSSQTVTDQAPTSDNNQEKSDSNANNGNENGETATPTDGATGDNAGNDGAANNEANANGNAGNTGNGGATNNGNGGAANNGNAGNGVANNGNAGAGNAGAGAGDNDGDATTTTENIVVENPWESHATSWRPQTLNVSTPEVNVNLPQLDSVKTAYVQGESTEGTPVNNAIQKGGKITYVIKVTNTGNQTANGVMIYDVVPEGTKLVEDSELNKNLTIQTIKQGKKDVQRIVWERNVEAGEDKSISVSFEVEVTADSLNTITNTAKVNGKDTDKTETPVITSSKVAKIENDKVTYVKVGETIEYIIKAKNSSKIDGVTTIEDKIPEGTTLVEDSVEKDEEDVVIQDNKIIWKNVKVPAKTDDKDGEKAVSFKVIVNEQSPKYIENYAVVADTNTNTTKNEVYTDINVKKKWEDNGYESVRPKSVEVGLYNGETKVGDNKTTDRNGKVSFNNLPKYNEDGSKIVYTIKEENNSEFYTASTANTENGYELEITNTLNNPSITSTKKASLVKVEKNEEGKETEKVTELAKGATVEAGDTIRYTITATNNDETKSTIRNISDDVPEGTENARKITKVTINGKAIKGLDGKEIEGVLEESKITWANVPIKAGETVEVSFDVTVSEKTTKMVRNLTAKVGEDPVPEGTENPVANIKIEKISDYEGKADKKKLKEMQEIIYTIKATNSGDGAKTIKISDMVPEGTTLVEGSILINNVAPENEEDVIIEDVEGIDDVKKEKKITWKNVNVPAKTEGKDGEATVSFRVTVNPIKDKKATIVNDKVEKDDEPENTSTTDEVEKEYVTVAVTKKWVEKDSYKKLRTDKIEVALTIAGKEDDKTAHKVIEPKDGNKESEEWTTVVFKKLDKYDLTTKREIEYGIIEITKNDNYKTVVGEPTKGNDKKVEITNTLKNDRIKIDVPVTKIWRDDGNAELRKTIHVQLKDTNYIATLTKPEKENTDENENEQDNNTWTSEFKDVQKYAGENDTDPINYTIEELDVPSYYKSTPSGNIVDGYTIVNEIKYDDEELQEEVKATKVWEDGNNKGGSRPDSITLELYANNEDTKKSVTLPKDGTETVEDTKKGTTTITASFGKLNKYDENGKITYTVKEAEEQDGKMAGKKDSTYEVKYDGLKVTNKVDFTSIKSEVKATKVWEDGNNKGGSRPDSITLKLYADDEDTNKSVTLPKDGTETVEDTEKGTTTITATFGSLSEYDKDGKKIEYTIKEAEEQDGKMSGKKNSTYEVKYDDEELKVTNKVDFTSIKSEVKATKVWEDGNNKGGSRPNSITLKLYADDEDTNKSVTLPKDGTETVEDTEKGTTTITATFGSLSEYDKDGKKIEYTIKEAEEQDGKMSGKKDSTYEVKYDDDGLKVTNKVDFTSIKSEVKATKVWEDGNNKGGSRPDSITLKLYADDEDTKKSVTLPKDGTETVEDTEKGTTTITATFGSLSEYDKDGKKIEYTIKEAEEQDGKMAGKKNSTYEVKYDDDGLKVTNKVDFTSIKSEVKATKVWEDGNNKGGSRPDSITLKLYADDEDTKKSVTLPKDGKETVEDTEKGTTTITATFGSLSEYDKDGKKIEYTIKEAEEQDGKMSGKKDSTYEVKYDDDGLKVTNKVDFTSIKDELKVTKIWKDEKTKTESRPDSIKIAIYSSKKQVNEYGEEVEVATLEKTVTLPEEASQKSEDRWATDVSLNKYDANGNKISYFIKELDDKNQPIEENGKFTGKANIKYTATYNDKKLEVTNKAETRYVVEYYTNGDYRKEFTIKASADVGDKVSFDKVPTELKDEGFEWIGYKGIGKTEMSDTIQEEIVLAEGDNTIRVYLGKPDVSISKATPDKTVNAYDDINYTITLTNKGWKATEIDVEDELKGTTYVEKSSKVANKAKEPDISKNDKNQVLTWEKVKVAAASESNKETTTEITFKVKTAKDSFGATIDNKAKDATNNKNSNTVNTNVNELTVNYDEYKEGQKGTDLNIIFIVDNSSSMNEPVSGSYDYDTWKYTTYDGEYKFGYPVAKKDKANTRYENAKSALDGFIEAQKKNSNNSITVINFNANATNQASKILVLEEKGYKKEKRYGYDYINDSYVYDSDYSTLNLEGAGAFKICITEKGDKYVQATDGLWHKYSIEDSTQGARVVGSTTDGKTSKNDLQKLVGKMTIGDSRAGFATYISPAYDLAKEYVQNDKKNIVIILADGQFNGKYDTSASALGVDEIYCIAYGSDISGNTSSLDSIATNGKATTATNTQSLLDEFDKIEESATGNSEKNKKTTKGVITLKEASDTIKVSKDCPILVTYDSGKKDKDGNIIYNELFRCESDDEETLEKYGLSIKGKVITWDAKKYINNYMEENPEDTDKVVPSEVFIRYYIPRK